MHEGQLKKTRGRPKLEEARTYTARVCLTPTEGDKLSKLAEEANLTVSDYIRSKIL